MEKISNIVRGNARVSSADMKGSSAVRPGVPAYGRPVGESSQTGPPAESTASRAAALHNEMAEARRSRSQDNVVAQLADNFFMTRIRRPDEEVQAGGSAGGPQTQIQIQAPKRAIAKASEVVPQMSDEDIEVSAQTEAVETAQPSGYTPRGSYVNVQA